MTIYDIIYSVTEQFPYIMDGLKRVFWFVGVCIFAFSGKVLLSATSNERGVKAGAWFGLFFSTFLLSVERWMNIATSTLYGVNLGPIYRVGDGFQKTNDAAMIFSAAEVYVMAFGWFGFFAAIVKLIEAPRHNNPGMKRKAMIGMGIAVACANIQFTIDVAGKTFGVDNAYAEIREKLTK
ncbi:hypothetical protein [Pseudoalteromonas prydzensis]|uniref:hypothetical protein n=1 Tax=Pseudoalteromonas prydzensis TaxID=182141 RepID=UPI003FD0880F